MTENWVRYIPTGGGEFVEAGPFIGPDPQEALRAKAHDEERRRQAGLAELIHEIGYIADDGDLENARSLTAMVPRLSLPPALGAQITAALEAFARASEQLAEAQAALVKATTPPLRVGDIRINLQVNTDALIRAREMVARLDAEQQATASASGLNPQAAAIWEAFGRPGTVQLLDNAGVSVTAATLDQVARMPGFFPFLRDALASAVDPVAMAQRVVDSYASVNEELVRRSCIHVGPEGLRSFSGIIIRTASGDVAYRNELTFESEGVEAKFYQSLPPSDAFSFEDTPPPELVVEPHEQAIAAPPPPDGDTARHLSLMQAIDARLEAARASGRRVNVLEVGAVEAALLGQTTGYNHMLSDGQVVGLVVRRIDRDAALSVYYDPEA